MAKKANNPDRYRPPFRDLTYQSGHIKKWHLEMMSAATGRKISYLRRKNRHHYFPSVLANTARYLRRIDFRTEDPYYDFIVNNIRAVLMKMGRIGRSEISVCGGKISGGEKKIKNHLDGLAADLDIYKYCFVPAYLHELFNKLFAGELTPPEVLLKLEWMFDDRRFYNGENKENLIDFLVSICVIEKKRIFTREQIREISMLRKSKDDVKNIEILKFLGLEIADIVDMLDMYFFHPYWKQERYQNHFLLLMFLKPMDRLKKTNISMYMEYYRSNGLHRIFTDMKEDNIRLLTLFLSRFSEMEEREFKGFRRGQYL